MIFSTPPHDSKIPSISSLCGGAGSIGFVTRGRIPRILLVSWRETNRTELTIIKTCGFLQVFKHFTSVMLVKFSFCQDPGRHIFPIIVVVLS